MRVSRASVFGTLLLAVLTLAAAGTASAQAWLPPKGEAAFSLGWSRTWASHHIGYDGVIASPGDMTWNNAVSDLSYGVTDRFAVRVNIPFVTSSYVGTRPHIPRPGGLTLDDGSRHSTFTDFRAEVRFKATTGALAVTPVVAIVFPSHWYESHGHSSFGNNSVEGQLGINVGRVLDPLLPNAYLQARYVYAVPEEYLGIRPTRSNVVFDLGYFVTGSLTVSTFGAYMKTHSGWRATIDYPPNTEPGLLVSRPVVEARLLPLRGRRELRAHRLDGSEPELLRDTLGPQRRQHVRDRPERHLWLLSGPGDQEEQRPAAVTSRGRSLLALAASLLVTGAAGAVDRRPVDVGQPLPAFEATSL